MKKQMVTAALAATLVLSSLAGCTSSKDQAADKTVTLQEIYDANAALTDKLENGTEMDATVSIEVSGKSESVLSLLGYEGEDLGLSSTMDVKATKEVQNIDGTVDITLGTTTSAEDVTMWNGDGKSYTYSSDSESWSVTDESSLLSSLESEEDSYETQMKDSIAKLQEKIDDADNTDVTLEKKDGAYEFHCAMALSELADMDGMDQIFDTTSQLGITADSFKEMTGNIVVDASFDADSLLIKSFELSIDDNAKTDIQNLLGSILPLEDPNLVLKADFTFTENSTLAIPEDVKASAEESDSSLDTDILDDLGNEEEE